MDNFSINDLNYFKYGSKGDFYHKYILSKIFINGTMDENPRTKYKDGTPAYTKSYNNEILQFDLSEYESPLITLRPMAWKNAIREVLWIWQDESNDLNLLKNKYGINWWDNWALEDNTIGACYGYSVKKHNLMKNLLEDIKNNPFGRRHIASLWQEEDFKLPHALKPCAFMIMCNVRKPKIETEDNKNYLDMTLVIRSSDTPTAQVLNLFQYSALQLMIARHCDLLPGIFTCFIENVHLYDRHFDAAKELLNRKPVICYPKLILNPDKTNFYDIDVNDFILEDYPTDRIISVNPQISIFKNEIAI